MCLLLLMAVSQLPRCFSYCGTSLRTVRVHEQFNLAHRGSTVLFSSEAGGDGAQRRKKRRRARATPQPLMENSAPQEIEDVEARPSTSMESSADNIENINRIEELEVAKMKYQNKMNELSRDDSKLPALSGTAQARKESYEDSGNNAFQNFIAEYQKPTPEGQEPKLVQTVKQITWGAVIVRKVIREHNIMNIFCFIIF